MFVKELKKNKFCTILIIEICAVSAKNKVACVYATKRQKQKT